MDTVLKKAEVIVTAHLTAKQGCEDSLRVGMSEMVKCCSHHVGMPVYRAHQCVEEPREFMYYEEYESSEDMLRHETSAERKAWDSIRDNLTERRTLRHWRLIAVCCRVQKV